MLSGASAHPFYVSCMPSAMSSTFHRYRVSWAAFFFVFCSICKAPSHSMLCILCALCCTSCCSCFILFWGILASPYFHILRISCGYVHKHHYSTTASASKPLNLSFLRIPLSFFQLSVSVATFIFLSSVMFQENHSALSQSSSIFCIRLQFISCCR